MRILMLAIPMVWPIRGFAVLLCCVIQARASAFTGETHENVVDVILKKQHKLIHNRAEFAGGFQHLNGRQSASAPPGSSRYLGAATSVR